MPQQAWQGCVRPDLVPGKTVAFGLDFDDDRKTGVLMSSGPVTDIDGGVVTPLELVTETSDLESLIRRAADNAVRFNGWVLVGAGSPAASAIPTLEKLTGYGRKGKHRVKVLAQPEMARAVGSFYDATVARRLSHRDDPRLNDDVIHAGRRKVGDVFVWDRHGPLTAATLARWGALMAPPVVSAGSSSIGTPVAAQRLRQGRAGLPDRRIPVRR